MPTWSELRRYGIKLFEEGNANSVPDAPYGRSECRSEAANADSDAPYARSECRSEAANADSNAPYARSGCRSEAANADSNTPYGRSECRSVAENPELNDLYWKNECRLEVNILLEWASGMSKTRLLANGDEQANEAAILKFNDGLRRRLEYEPIAYITGMTGFYGLDFITNPDTLIPRPETEHLVELVLNEIRSSEQPKPGPRLLEFGTGTGCIPVSLLTEIRELTAVSIDISSDALKTAEQNARRHGVNARLTLLCADMMSDEVIALCRSANCADQPHENNDDTNITSKGCKHISGQPSANNHNDANENSAGMIPSNINSMPENKNSFDIIVSNPPYIPAGEIPDLMADVRLFEPHVALDGGNDGLVFYRRIAELLAELLSEDGFAGVEVGFNQADAVQQIFSQKGYLSVVHRDYAGLPRVVVAKRCASQIKSGVQHSSNDG